MPQSSADYVFMSYSRRDDIVMRRIVIFLRQQGIKVWVDNEKLIPGTPIWEVEIEKAIQGASAVIVVLSPDSKNSEWVRREISLADQYRKRVFPVLVRGDEETSITLRLINRQFVDIRQDEEIGLNSLNASLLRYLEELDAQEENAKKEASRLAARKTRDEKRLAKQKAEEERIAREKENAGRVSNLTNENEKRFDAQKVEEERIAHEKTETERKSKEETDRLAAQKTNENTGRVSNPTNADAEKESQAKSLTYARTDREKEELARKNAEIYNRSREAAAKATQAFLPKLKIPALVLVAGLIGYFLWQGISSLIPAPTAETRTPQVTPFVPTTTFTVVTPAETMTPAPTETIVSTLEPGATMTGEHGETLVYVPAGEFTMGSDANSDEQPIHTVYLDAFWIDQTEVTNKQYKACVDAGTCEPPSSKSSSTHPSYYENPEFDNYPILNVNWDKANRYCEVWAGGDLPTEAQWEKAARGIDARTYPWGENIDCDKANYQPSCIGDTSPVGNYKSGKSPYNAYDMAGNVWEWVNDYYQSDYYANLGDNASNPQGPTSSDLRVLRGGSWVSDNDIARSVDRFGFTPDDTRYFVGFRCAGSP